ncbi:alpha/beta hydrolase [Mucilaginibacter sp. UR6-1]|uniref:alpha/beta fold hydrolase n=1 Tax=Mucilaginibacter sp. UR6-1 TaxID=1435643 RepID=UPI001E624332|nr:alpha/beta hydrolase [Mucilaginibacter sp. UR6-1]MCC8410767.1 alpha/beta hydrolase [Mucilaginibacter sp. UR6-1]
MELKYQNQQLIRKWPGFTSQSVSVNGTALHYVQGGAGPVLICLPGWPQSWYSYHPVGSQLAKHFKVIVVDIRGMGDSATPPSGYDKKTMATDIYELMSQLDIDQAHVIGHDIGGMVASSLAYNFPQVVTSLILADGLHPNEGMMQMRLMPAPGKFGNKIDNEQPYTWWMGFNQVKGLPEQLLQGRYRYLLDWLFQYVMSDDSKMSDFDRSVYAAIYDQPERIRASNAWYQTFNQDIADAKTYSKFKMPVLGIASNVSYGFYQYALPMIADDYTIVHLKGTGHYMFEENPEAVYEAVLEHIARQPVSS